MAVHTKIETAPVDTLLLDQKNPRLGRQKVQKNLSQEAILNEMRNFILDELAISILQSGFWPQEALIAVKERSVKLTVVEGNRRLAALKWLKKAISGEDVPDEWAEIIKNHATKQSLTSLRELLDDVPYILADSRKDVEAYLGFRHVTGIKQWDPAEKAEYISNLIESGMSYSQVTDAIGSKVHSVRQNYISFRILLQMEELKGIHIPSVEEKFSVLTLSLRTDGVQTYLSVDMTVDPAKAKRPIPPNKLKHLEKFALWLFGNDEKGISPVITDSRKIEQFAKVLESEKAVHYLETAKPPRFETAYRIAGGDAADVAQFLEQSWFQLEEALGVIHHVKESNRVKEAAQRIVTDAGQLLVIYPEFKKLICGKKEHDE